VATTLLDDLKDLIDLVSADDSAALRSLLEKPENLKFAQELKDGRLRQADYSRFLNENRQKLAKVDEWKTWADKNVPLHQKLVEDYTTLENSHKTLQQQADDYREKLAKVQAGEMDVDEATLNARIDQRLSGGYYTRSEIDKIVKDEAQKMAREESTQTLNGLTNKFLTETWPAATEIMSTLIECSFSHQQEFGTPLSRDQRKEIGDLMKSRNIEDPLKAYESWVEPKRSQKRNDEEVDRRVNERLQNQNFPGVSGVPVEDLGPMQARKVEGALPKLPDDAVLGEGSLAMAAAQELRKDGKY
jgi:hypothetical protein